MQEMFASVAIDDAAAPQILAAPPPPPRENAKPTGLQKTAMVSGEEDDGLVQEQGKKTKEQQRRSRGALIRERKLAIVQKYCKPAPEYSMRAIIEARELVSTVECFREVWECKAIRFSWHSDCPPFQHARCFVQTQ